MKLCSDKILGFLSQLEELHLRKHAEFQSIKGHSNTNKVNDYLVPVWWRAFDKEVQEKFDSLFSTYSPLLNELGPWRMQVIQAGEEASQSSRSSIYT